MNGMSEPKLDAFQQSAYLAFLQEAKTKHKPIRIAFLEPSGGDEFKTVLQKLKNDGYAVFLINSEENHDCSA
jgi:basic membrane lipoprotein Med (substrate-binding protein (PBP1-ABC) superfamily)